MVNEAIDDEIFFCCETILVESDRLTIVTGLGWFKYGRW